MVIDVADRVEKNALRHKGMLVRTSRFTLEEFDANKIANSLIREAKVPPDLAQKAAKETERRLLKSKTKYVNAPLIREVVNAILIEKGLEDYRHKLARLGLPVHEVTALVEAKERDKDVVQPFESALSIAGKTVFREYVLLNVFPRDIADAHMSGALHINDLSTWILKPNEIMHDLRFFFQNGIAYASNSLQLLGKPPQNLDDALSIAFNVLLHSRKEVNQTQTFYHFNLFLAPFARGIDQTKIKESLRLFITNVSQHIDAALGLELSIPSFVMNKTAVGPEGKTCGAYADFAQEALLIAALVLEIFIEESALKPLLNPKLILGISSETFADEKAKPILMKAHALALNRGIPYFANVLPKEEKYAVFSVSGAKFDSDLSSDWETDTLRTGCIGCVAINLPRIAYESEQDKNKFFELLKERCELAARALEIKYRALKQYGRTSLPFLMQSTNGDIYFRLENCSSIINLAGFREAIEAFCNKPLDSEESGKLAEEVVKTILAFKHKIGRRHGKRLFPTILCSLEASERLAQLDIEKYGVAKVKFSGTREKPFYSTTKRLQLQVGNFPYVQSEQLETLNKIKGLNSGGNLNIIELEGTEYTIEQLLDFTKSLVEKQIVELFTFNRKVTYCINCKKSWFGILHKCPSCGSIGTLAKFDKYNST